VGKKPRTTYVKTMATTSPELLSIKKAKGCALLRWHGVALIRMHSGSGRHPHGTAPRGNRTSTPHLAAVPDPAPCKTATHLVVVRPSTPHLAAIPASCSCIPSLNTAPGRRPSVLLLHQHVAAVPYSRVMRII
jgi:hypothetical protein